MPLNRDRPRRALGALALVGVVVCLLAAAQPLPAWEGTAHRLITNKAIETLPFPLRAFFENNRRTLLLLSADSSQWGESAPTLDAGYIRLDRYGRYPFAELPRDYNQAVRKFKRETVTTNGTLPWSIGNYSLRLEEAFRNQQWDDVKLYAAILARYVAEAHDSFNTTDNFTGGQSNQFGVDSRYGASLVGRYQLFFIIRPGVAYKSDDPTAHAFGMVMQAHTWVDNILLADAQARTGKIDYNDEYYDAFYDAVGAVLVRQLTDASQNVGAYWYTAWLNAGRPPLPAR